MIVRTALPDALLTSPKGPCVGAGGHARVRVRRGRQHDQIGPVGAVRLDGEGRPGGGHGDRGRVRAEQPHRDLTQFRLRAAHAPVVLAGEIAVDAIAGGDVFTSQRQRVGRHDRRRAGQEGGPSRAHGRTGVGGDRVFGLERVKAAVAAEGVAGAEAAELAVDETASLQAHEPPRGADHPHRPRRPAFGVGDAHRQRREAGRFGLAESRFGVRGQDVGRRQRGSLLEQQRSPAGAGQDHDGGNRRNDDPGALPPAPLARRSGTRRLGFDRPTGPRRTGVAGRRCRAGPRAGAVRSRRSCSCRLRPLDALVRLDISVRVLGARRVERLAQTSPCSVQAHEGRRPRAAHDAAYLGRLELLPVAQEQRFPVRRGEVVERASPGPGRGAPDPRPPRRRHPHRSPPPPSRPRAGLAGAAAWRRPGAGRRAPAGRPRRATAAARPAAARAGATRPGTPGP